MNFLGCVKKCRRYSCWGKEGPNAPFLTNNDVQLKTVHYVEDDGYVLPRKSFRYQPWRAPPVGDYMTYTGRDITVCHRLFDHRPGDIRKDRTKLQLALAKRVKLVKLSPNGENPPDRDSHRWI